MELKYCREFALTDLDRARRYAADEAARGAAPDSIRSAAMWAIEYWLRTHDIQPDVGNGWHSMLYQFMHAAPKDDPAYDLSIVAQLAGSHDAYYLGWPDEGPPPPDEALPLLLARADSAIRAALTER